MTKTWNFIFILIGCIGIALCLFGFSVASLSFQDLELTSPSGQKTSFQKEKNLILDQNQAGEYKVQGRVNRPVFSQTHLKIIPDNCLRGIKINEREVDLSSIPEKNLCDTSNGFSLNLEDSLQIGNNQIEFTVQDYGGRFQLLIYNSQQDIIFQILAAGSLLSVLLLLVGLLRLLQFDSWQIGFIFTGLITRLVYLSYTNYLTRSHDVDGHIDYIKYITNATLPNPQDCWQCYQPPQYYGLSAGVIQVWRLFGLDQVADFRLLIQLQSVTLSVIFCVIGILIINLFFTKNTLKTQSNAYEQYFEKQKVDRSKPSLEFQFSRNLLLIGSAVLVFWPSTMLHSVRIGNDALLYVWYALALYFLCRWWLGLKNWNVYAAGLFAVLALLTKSNGAIIMLIIGISIFIRWTQQRTTKNFVTGILTAGIFVLGLGLAFIRSYLSNSQDWLVGNVQGLNDQLRVKNEAVNYLWLDLNSFFHYPGTSPWISDGGRDYFWNFLLKTSLFGEFEIRNELNQNIATILSLLLLAILGIIIIRIVSFPRDQLKMYIPLLLNLILLVTSIAYLRWRHPFAPSGDFRYILPVVLSLSVLIIPALSSVEKFPVLQFISKTLTWLFVIMSIAFILVPVFIPGVEGGVNY